MMYYSIFSCALLITKLVNSFFYHSYSFTTLWLLHKSCHLQNGPHLHLAWLILLPSPTLFTIHIPTKSPLLFPFSHVPAHHQTSVFFSFFFFFFPSLIIPHYNSCLLHKNCHLQDPHLHFVWWVYLPYPSPPKTHYLFPFSHVLDSFLIIKLVLFLPSPSNIPHYLQLFSVQKGLLSLTGLKFIVDNPSSDKSYLT